MIEAILLQIPPPVREALWVCAAYHGNCLVYAEHVLLHHLIVPLLDLIQSPYHGIIVVLVAECLLHVHQQVPHRDIFALAECAGPFARVPTSSYCSRKASTLKCQRVYVTSAPGSVNLKIGISNLVGASHFLSLLPLQPLCLCWRPAVSLTVEYPSESSAPPVWGRGGQTPSADCSTLGLQWPSVWLRCPHTSGEPCLGHLSHPRGSFSLLRCTSHQLAQGVRLPCSYNWCTMDRVLHPTSQPSAVGGSN